MENFIDRVREGEKLRIQLHTIVLFRLSCSNFYVRKSWVVVEKVHPCSFIWHFRSMVKSWLENCLVICSSQGKIEVFGLVGSIFHTSLKCRSLREYIWSFKGPKHLIVVYISSLWLLSWTIARTAWRAESIWLPSDWLVAVFFFFWVIQ